MWAVEGARHYRLGPRPSSGRQGEQVTEIDCSRHVGKRRAGKSDAIDAIRAPASCWPDRTPPSCAPTATAKRCACALYIRTSASPPREQGERPGALLTRSG